MTDFTLKFNFENPGEADIFADVIGSYPAIRSGATVLNNDSEVVIIPTGKPELMPAIVAEIAQCMDTAKPAAGRYPWKN